MLNALYFSLSYSKTEQHKHIITPKCHHSFAWFYVSLFFSPSYSVRITFRQTAEEGTWLSSVRKFFFYVCVHLYFIRGISVSFKLSIHIIVASNACSTRCYDKWWMSVRYRRVIIHTHICLRFMTIDFSWIYAHFLFSLVLNIAACIDLVKVSCCSAGMGCKRFIAPIIACLWKKWCDNNVDS